MPRTQTSRNPTIALRGATVTFATPPSPASRTAIHIPPDSPFDSDLHWHETYTEYFRITKGVMSVVLEDVTGALQTYYIGKESGIVEIPKGRRHRLRPGDSTGPWEEWKDKLEWREGGMISKEEWVSEIRGEEWTSPQDGRKEMFFRNLAGIAGDRSGGALDGVWFVLGVLCIFREFDNWPAFLGGRMRSLELVVSHAVLCVASWVGWGLGLRGSYEEYAPVELRGVKGAGKVERRKDL